MIKDRMGIYRKSKTDVPDYGSLFLIKESKNAVNEYGGSDSADVEKLALITNAACGSTCLLTDGTLYRKEIDGWNEIGGE